MDKELILKERARLMAQEINEEKLNQNILEIVEFQVEDERYGIETAFIQKVICIEHLTSVPGLPNFMKGIINIHGKILPIIDVRQLFMLKQSAFSEMNQAIIFQYQHCTMGILADKILGVKKISEPELQINMPTLTGDRQAYLKVISLSQIAILDPVKLCLDEKMRVDYKE